MGMVYEAMEASYWGRSWRVGLPFSRFAGGVLSVGTSAKEAYDGVRAWQEGDRRDASVRFLGAAAPALSMLGPAGMGASAVVGLGILCYDRRDQIRSMFNL